MLAPAIRLGSSLLGKGINVTKIGIRESSGILKKAILKRTKIKREQIARSKVLDKRRLERQRREEKEGLLEAIPKGIGGKIVGGAQNFVQSILEFIGILLVGWLVNNLPSIITMVQNLIKRIQTLVSSLTGFTKNLLKWTGGLGNVIGAYAKNYASLDFNDSSGRVKKAMKDLNDSFKAMQNDIDKGFRSLATPLGQGEGEEAAAPFGTDYTSPAGPGLEGLATYVMRAESGQNYNVLSGGQTDPNLTRMTLTQLESAYSGRAAGAPQFMPSTAIGVARRMRLDPNQIIYSPENQRMLLMAHLRQLGYDEFAAGKMSSVEFGKRIAQQYRALPDPRTGATYADQYARDNRAQRTTQSFMAQLEASKSRDLRMSSGSAVFGETGNVNNAPNWVHGHFQNPASKDELIRDTFPYVKKLLQQNVPVVITGGPGEEQLSKNMNDAAIRAAISRGVDRHSNRTRGYYAVDVSVPQGTRVPLPLQDIRRGTGAEGISGVIPGSRTFVGHLASGSRSSSAAEIAAMRRGVPSLDNQRRRQQIIVIDEEQPTNITPVGANGGGVVIIANESLNRFMKTKLLLELAYT